MRWSTTRIVVFEIILPFTFTFSPRRAILSMLNNRDLGLELTAGDIDIALALGDRGSPAVPEFGLPGPPTSRLQSSKFAHAHISRNVNERVRGSTRGPDEMNPVDVGHGRLSQSRTSALGIPATSVPIRPW